MSIAVGRKLWTASFAACLLTAVRTPAAPAGVSAWFVDSLVKVFPTDPPGSHRLDSPEFWAARNQHLSVQLAIRSPRALSGVEVAVPPLHDAAGHTISSVSAQHVGYVVVGSHTWDCPPEELIGEAPGWYPDPLLDFPLALEANRAAPLWVTIHVPTDATPGLYRGVIAVSAGGRVLIRAPFRLRVLDASVPEARTLRVTNWFSLDDKVSRQFYGAPAFSPQWWTLVANVAGVLADHRQNVILTPLLELIQPRIEGGQIQYDFANFDRWVETFQKAGAIGFIEGSHLLDRAGAYEAALQVHTLQIVDGAVQSQSLPPDDPRVEPFLIGFLSALNTHLTDKGWRSIYYQHILDEAHGGEPPYYGKFADLVRRYLPGIPTIDAVDADRMPEILQRDCDIWVPQLGKFDDQMRLLRQRMDSGHPVWFYTCLFPQKRYLNRLIDFPLLKARLLPWLDFRYGFTGFLHWGGNFWTPKPMLDTQPVIDANTELLPSGDAFIVYPDRAHDSVESSIRLEAMRAGFEDYEMLRLLEATDAREAQQIAGTAISSFTEYVRDPRMFRRIERQLLEALAKQGPTPSPAAGAE